MKDFSFFPKDQQNTELEEGEKVLDQPKHRESSFPTPIGNMAIGGTGFVICPDSLLESWKKWSKRLQTKETVPSPPPATIRMLSNWRVSQSREYS